MDAETILVCLTITGRDEPNPRLTAEAFTDRRLGLIYEAAVSLVADGKDIHPEFVIDRLITHRKLEEAGGREHVWRVATAVGKDVPIAPEVIVKSLLDDQHIKQASLLAEALPAALKVSSREEAQARLRDFLSIMEKLAEDETSEAQSWREDLVGVGKDFDDLASGKMSGIPTGFEKLDKILLGGFRPGEFIILAARTSTGKSALALQWALHAASLGYRTVFFTYEMSRRALYQRAVIMKSGYPRRTIREGRADPERIKKVIRSLEEYPLRIVNASAWCVDELAAEAKRLSRKQELGRLDLIIIDYLQEITPRTRAETHEREIAEITKALKEMALKFQVPVIALSQFNRRAELRVDARGRLSDLRESGSIEQRADTVLGLFRPGLYDKRFISAYAILYILKQREGEIETEIELDFTGEVYRFEPWRRNPGEERKKKEEEPARKKRGKEDDE